MPAKNRNEYARKWRAGHREQVKYWHRERRLKTKLTVLTHYGGGRCACVICGESRLACLSIDHINGDGYEHRKEIGSSGRSIYEWLLVRNFPKGYQTLCMNDQWVKRVINNEIPGGLKLYPEIKKLKGFPYRQEQALDILRKSTNGMTTNELGKSLDISRDSADKVVLRLKKKHLITKQGGIGKRQQGGRWLTMSDISSLLEATDIIK